jgi:DNA-directed RNA polymerase subunit N (RpoN/RPB10)
MWVNGEVYRRLVDDLSALRDTVAEERIRHEGLTQSNAAAFGKVHEDLGLERGRREVLSHQTLVQKSMVEFLCARVNQLEAERVIMLRHLTSIDLPAPTLHAEHPEPGGAAAALAGLGIFADDPRHAPKGWHADGSVNYDGAPDAVVP